mgnify:CR=1 FL=1
MQSKPRGFTLAELVLSLAITTVIGLAVTAVAAAISNINEQAEAYYEYLQSGRVASTKVEELLRPALLVTATSDSAVVVWMKDEVDIGTINVSEVAEIYFDSSTNELLMKTTEFPDSLKTNTRSALDIDLALSDLTSILSLDLGSGHASYDVIRVLAQNVKSFDVYPDVPAPMTTLLKFKIVIGDHGQTVTQYGAVALRAPSTSKVTTSNGTYYLN